MKWSVRIPGGVAAFHTRQGERCSGGVDGDKGSWHSSCQLHTPRWCLPGPTDFSWGRARDGPALTSLLVCLTLLTIPRSPCPKNPGPCACTRYWNPDSRLKRKRKWVFRIFLWLNFQFPFGKLNVFSEFELLPWKMLRVLISLLNKKVFCFLFVFVLRVMGAHSRKFENVVWLEIHIPQFLEKCALKIWYFPGDPTFCFCAQSYFV